MRAEINEIETNKIIPVLCIFVVGILKNFRFCMLILCSVALSKVFITSKRFFGKVFRAF
jgi:hypothetical protein